MKPAIAERKSVKPLKENEIRRLKGDLYSPLKPKTAIVPSTVSTPAPVHSYKLTPQLARDMSSAIPTALSEATSSTNKPVSEPVVNSFISTLQNLVKSLPENVPEASKFAFDLPWRRFPWHWPRVGRFDPRVGSFGLALARVWPPYASGVRDGEAVTWHVHQTNSCG